jgi:hypothetical protein
MELYKCLPRLSQIAHARAGQQVVTKEQQAAEHSLVVGARLWLLVSKMAIEYALSSSRLMSFNGADI